MKGINDMWKVVIVRDGTFTRRIYDQIVEF